MAVVSIRVSLIAPVPLAAALLMPDIALRRQLKVVPGVLLVGVYAKGVPLHTAGGVRELLKVPGLLTTTTIESLLMLKAVVHVSMIKQLMVSSVDSVSTI